MPNRLAQETSPYLRQHADNPVDWYPFGDEAFALARSTDRPILLSIGYSACHWCHVMAHESFEDAATAALMNERFVCIKVDREERPDVDLIYQQALQLLGEGGGWPLTMFLVPDGTPYYGGTYFPPADRFGRPSFKRLLTGLSNAWRSQRQEVLDNAKQFAGGLKHIATHGRSAKAEPMIVDSVDRAAAKLLTRVDRQLGGLGDAPKFPNPKAFELLLRAAERARKRGESSDADELVDAVRVTLVGMAQGGIYDHLGGGFARYSTDAEWLVPHFEKMLYDNAQLLSLYTEAWQVTPEPLFARAVAETVDYLIRDLGATHSDGAKAGFSAAEDADSEGVEGKFYVWTPADLAALLSPESATLFARVYDVTHKGNWNDPHGHAPAESSILRRKPGSPALSERDAVEVEAARAILFAARQKRVRPGLDDKILAGWNGLAIAGLAEAGRVFHLPHAVDAARAAADLVLTRMRDANGRLLRTLSPSGEAKLPGTLDDHAAVADGLIALYEATGEARWLDEAHALTALCVRLFYAADERAFYLTATADPPLIQRPVSTFDNAVPSGMSLCIENLIRLGDVYGEPSWLHIAGDVLESHYARAMENPFGFANLLCALDLYLCRPTEIVIAGADSGALLDVVDGIYLPNRVLIRAASTAPAGLAPLVAGKVGTVGSAGATAYVCRDFACQRPTADPTELAVLLRS